MIHILTSKQLAVIESILECLERGEKPVMNHICGSLGLREGYYQSAIRRVSFRKELKKILEDAIDVDTLILLKLRIATDDISTTTLAKLYSEKDKRPSSDGDSYEDMLNKQKNHSRGQPSGNERPSEEKDNLPPQGEEEMPSAIKPN